MSFLTSFIYIYRSVFNKVYRYARKKKKIQYSIVWRGRYWGPCESRWDILYTYVQRAEEEAHKIYCNHASSDEPSVAATSVCPTGFPRNKILRAWKKIIRVRGQTRRPEPWPPKIARDPIRIFLEYVIRFLSRVPTIIIFIFSPFFSRVSAAAMTMTTTTPGRRQHRPLSSLFFFSALKSLPERRPRRETGSAFAIYTRPKRKRFVLFAPERTSPQTTHPRLLSNTRTTRSLPPRLSASVVPRRIAFHARLHQQRARYTTRTAQVRGSSGKTHTSRTMRSQRNDKMSILGSRTNVSTCIMNV